MTSRLLLLLILVYSSIIITAGAAAIPPPPPPPPPSPLSSPDSCFHVPTPHPVQAAAFGLIEEARLLFLKLATQSQSSYVETRVGKVHVLRCPGKKGTEGMPPIVLVHGVCSTAHDFLPMFGLRQCARELVVLDMPGHFKSGIHVADPDIQTLVASVVDVILHISSSNSDGNAGKVILVGNSLGGLVAIRVALQIPRQIAALCLLSPAGAPLTKCELADVKRSFQLQSHQDGLDFVSKVFAFPEKLPHVMRSVMAWACRLRTSTGAIHTIMNKASPCHMLSKRDLRGLRGLPILLVWGKHEKVLLPHHLTFFQKHLPSKSTTFCTDEEFGHVPFLDDPKRLLTIMQDFILQCSVNRPVMEERQASAHC